MNTIHAQHITKATLLAVFTSALFAASAPASTISFSDTKTVGATYTDFSLGKFNTGLGTLKAVEIKVDFSTLEGSFTVTSLSASVVTITAFDTAFRVRQSPTNSIGFTLVDTSLPDAETTPDWNATSVPANSSQVYTIVGGQSYTITPQSISSGYFSAYQSAGGVGAVVIQGRNTPTIAASGGAYSVDPTATVANTKMTVTYTYDAVPEPGTIGLLALAGGTALLVVRRRQTK